jgi:hypothetical protein
MSIKRKPNKVPKPGDRIARVLRNRHGVTSVHSRMVVALEKRYPRGITVVYKRKKNSTKFCRCSLTDWKRWARSASVPLW